MEPNGDAPPPKTAEFRRWHGLAAVLPAVRRALGEGGGKVNGWAVMAAVLGVDEVCDRLSAGVDTISVMSQLPIFSTECQTEGEVKR